MKAVKILRSGLSWLLLAAALAPMHTLQAQSRNQTVDPSLFEAMDYRLIGPFRGGRVTAVTGVPGDEFTYFMGSTGGGVWKTRDGGESWQNLTDGQISVGSIGAVTVAPSDHNVVYVGTGSACPRGNISIGKGMYRSEDGGKNWNFAGLPNAGLIGAVRVDPRDPDRVYVAALGNIFGPNPERGVYRTKDGGQSWDKVLFVSDSTGAVDLAMDPQNPRILYAAMWRAERKPWTLVDGGREGGVWKSTDGGDTWTKLGGGLPGGLLGRIGVTVSPVNPDRVWVMLEAAREEDGGLYRSDDGGKTFKRINREHKLRARAWYYTHITADPKDENTVYVMNAGFYRSVDGGKHFDRVRTPHGDNHDLWINPDRTDIMIESNDGGAAVTFDGGETWSTQNNQPTAEFYRVTVDNQFPYRVYGAQQDNTTLSLPSVSPGGLDPIQQWFSVGGGESGHIAVDPRDPDIVYAGNYIGMITRLDRDKGHMRDVVAYPQLHDGTAPRDIKYRYQWNAPIRISPHNPDVLYHTSQYVHRSTNGGQSWEVISPDLSTDNDDYQDLPGGPIQHDHTGVELYTTIFAFEESPLTQGVLWAGSDDGLVHISKDNGQSWQDITPKDMPADGTVNMIDLSATTPGRAFMAVYKYRENDSHPYIFRTNDYGQHWELLTDGKNGIPADHFVRVVREDPQKQGLLYAGTEFGMYISFDDGAHWQPFQQNLPVTPITDLQIHDNDLVVATQGRSFWIMDDLSVLRQVEAGELDRALHLFKPADALRTQLRGFRGDEAPQNPPRGASIYYFLGRQPDSLKLEILDGKDRVVAAYRSGDKKDRLDSGKGMHRKVWDLDYPAPRLVPDAIMSLSYTGGPSAPTGSYRVRLTADGESMEQPLELKADPRWEVTDADLEAQFELAVKVRDALTRVHEAIRKIRSVRSQLNSLLDVGEGRLDADTRSRARDLAAALTGLEQELLQTKNETGQDPINYPPQIDNQFAYLYTVVNGQDARPTEGSYQRFEDLQKQIQPYYVRLDDLINGDLAALNRGLEEQQVPHVVVGE